MFHHFYLNTQINPFLNNSLVKRNGPMFVFQRLTHLWELRIVLDLKYIFCKWIFSRYKLYFCLNFWDEDDCPHLYCYPNVLTTVNSGIFSGVYRSQQPTGNFEINILFNLLAVMFIDVWKNQGICYTMSTSLVRLA